MGQAVVAPLAERAARALAAGRWRDAVDLLGEADARTPLAPADLDLLARAAYAAGDPEAAVAAQERAHAALLAVGDHTGAAGAAVSIAMYLLMDTGLMAPVRGWLARAERLLEGTAGTPTHAMLAAVRMYERLFCGDFVTAREWSATAVALGTPDVPVAAAMGWLGAARMLIFDGRVDEGLALLDEVAVATVSGELDAVGVGIVYCELICAMQGLAQYDRAQEWTEAMERWRPGNAVGGFSGRCRVHRAEILRLRGSCAEAEAEVLRACDELRPWLRREFGWPLTELGTIRLRRGDLAGAEEAFLAARTHGWDPQPGLALLRLAQGDSGAAVTLVRDALERPANVPSKERPPNERLRRAPLLEAYVEVALATGDVVAARGAADELTGIAEVFRSHALLACAALARGRVALAEPDWDTAVRECDAALALWSDIEAPYEAAAARVALAAAYRGRGQRDRAELEQGTGEAALAAIGAVLVAAPGSAPSVPHAGLREVFRCEGDTRTVTFGGRTVLLRDLQGLRYLARLLAEPGREFHVLDLVAAERGVLPTAAAACRQRDLGPVLDDQAREAYRRRLAEVEQDLEDAQASGDADRAALADRDRAFLVAELASAYGIGGRARPTGATSERARAAVTRAVRYAMARVAEHHPELAGHLERTIRTGTYCTYAPDPRIPVMWDV